jgi:hypothetical protein
MHVATGVATLIGFMLIVAAVLGWLLVRHDMRKRGK